MLASIQGTGSQPVLDQGSWRRRDEQGHPRFTPGSMAVPGLGKLGQGQRRHPHAGLRWEIHSSMGTARLRFPAMGN